LSDIAGAPRRSGGRTDVGEREPLTAFVIGALAFAIACVAIFPAPAYAIGLGFLACAVAAIAAWTGDRFFGGFTIVMTVFNWFLLNPTALGRGPAFYLAFAFLLLPLAVMVARSRGTFSDERPAPRPPAFIPNPQDFFGGLALLAIALIAWRATRELPGQQGFAFGPGTAPRLFILLLALNASAIILTGLFSGATLERFHIRGPLVITAGVLVFAATIRTLGLIPSTFLLVLVSSAATDEVKWVQTVIWGVVLAIFCAVLFPYVLNLPMQLWPRF
jgi:putative tricarboxylic transport membrane protein